MSERRAPGQGDLGRGGWIHPPGTISWSDHLRVYEAYRMIHGSSQSAERIAERQGFGWSEIVLLLGRIPDSWQPLSQHGNPERATFVVFTCGLGRNEFDQLEKALEFVSRSRWACREIFEWLPDGTYRLVDCVARASR